MRTIVIPTRRRPISHQPKTWLDAVITTGTIVSRPRLRLRSRGGIKYEGKKTFRVLSCCFADLVDVITRRVADVRHRVRFYFGAPRRIYTHHRYNRVVGIYTYTAVYIPLCVYYLLSYLPIHIPI